MNTTAVPLPQIDVVAVAQRMLDHVVGYFGTRGWDLPERRYLSPGLPTLIADDGEHLALCLSSLASGVTPRSLNSSTGVQAAGAKSMHVPRANFGLRLMRCITSDVSPDVDDLNDDGLRLMADPGYLLTALFDWIDSDHQPYNANPITIVGDVDVVGPLGGLAGHVVKVTIGPVQ